MSFTQKTPYLVAIGGLDPSGLAGILADMQVFFHFKIPSRAVVTAVTAQNEKKFLSWKPVNLPLFRDQLRAVEGKIRGVKLGMLATLDHVRILLKWLRRVRPRHILWDPVLRSTTGAALLKAPNFSLPLRQLMKLCQILTPNVPEANWILQRKILNAAGMEKAALDLQNKTGRVVVLKGGHLKTGSRRAIDVFTDGNKLVRLDARRRPGKRRGTGCRFGAALLSELYLGRDALGAARLAKRYVLTDVFDAPPP